MNEFKQHKPNDQCVDTGLLASLRDNELTASEQADIRVHLAECADCSADERAMTVTSREVYNLLDTLGPPADETPHTAPALAAIQSKLDLATMYVKLDTQETSRQHRQLAIVHMSGQTDKVHLPQKNRQRRYAWIGAVVAAALIALLLLPNASAIADQFLSLFRVQQFQPVSVDPQSFSSDLMLNLKDFGDAQGHFNQIPDSLRQPTQVQVKAYLHFPLLLPSHLPTGVGHDIHFNLFAGQQQTFTFSAAQTRDYLERSGQSSVSIPAQLDGATFTVNTDTGVIVYYTDNTCPQGKDTSANNDTASSASTTSTSVQCNQAGQFYLAEVPSPIVKATGRASLKDLRDFMLSLPKLSPQMRNVIQHLDLDRGIVPLPLPSQAHARQVTVQGASGVVATIQQLKLGAVIWQSHDILYMVAGATANETELLNTANSLH